MRVRGSYTVEAALVCPFLCLIIFGMLSFTLSLYRDVVSFSEQAVGEVRESCLNAEALRLLRMVCQPTES